MTRPYDEYAASRRASWSPEAKAFAEQAAAMFRAEVEEMKQTRSESNE